MILQTAQWAVLALGVAAVSVSVALGWKIRKCHIGGTLNRALVFDYVAKSLASLATLAFSSDAVRRMISIGEDWNNVGPITATVLRLIIFGATLGSSFYLARVLQRHETESKHLEYRIRRALQDEKNVESAGKGPNTGGCVSRSLRDSGALQF